MKECIEHMNDVKKAAPIHRIDVVCYHNETTSVPYTDKDGKEQTRTETRKVITHQAGRNLTLTKMEKSKPGQRQGKSSPIRKEEILHMTLGLINLTIPTCLRFPRSGQLLLYKVNVLWIQGTTTHVRSLTILKATFWQR